MNLAALPKVELHLHLDCSLSYAAVAQLDPSVTEADYRARFVAPQKCASLADFLTCPPRMVALMQSEAALRLAVRDLFAQLARDHVIYAEVRYAPLLHTAGGLTAAAEEVLLLGSMAALTPIVAGLGTVTLAAHRIVLNTLSLAFLPGIGFAVAATVLVGQRGGAGEPAAARAVAGVALRWGVGWMSTVGALFALLAPQVVAIFVTAGAAEHEALVRVGSAGLIASALAQPGWAACMVLAGALRGAGKTRIPLIVSGGLSWLAVGLAWALVQVRPDLASVWAAFVILFPIEAAVLWWLWRRTLDASHPAV